MTTQPLHLIVAMSVSGAIGQAGKLPWHAPEDLKRFKRLTMGHAIIMGRKTFESIGSQPLRARTNIVLSATLDCDDPEAGRSRMSEAPTRLFAARSLADAIDIARRYDPSPFIIGGASVYAEALPLVTTAHITWIRGEYPDADTYFPVSPRAWLADFQLDSTSAGEGCVESYQTFERRTAQ